MSPTDASTPNWRENFPPWREIHSFNAKLSYVRNLGREAGIATKVIVNVPDFRLKYDVPGRRRDGSLTGQQPSRWLLRRTFTAVRNAVTGTILTLLGLILGELEFGHFAYRGRVRGQANSAAVRFADSVVAGHDRLRSQPLWILWSPAGAVLANVSDGGPGSLAPQATVPVLHMLWTAHDIDLPALDVEQRTLRWVDGSEVSFKSDAIVSVVN